MNWTTFLQSAEDYHRLAPFGFSHWLLEHPRFSLQAQGGDDDPDFKRLAGTIAALPDGSRVTFNLDLIPLPGDFPAIRQLLEFLQEQGIDAVRVQDFGLFHYLVEQTVFRLELDPHTGGGHPDWWRVFHATAGERLQVMHLPDQASLAQTRQLVAHFPGRVELLAVGPLLMYHSRRQLFAEDEMTGSSVQGRELQRPGQLFNWRQNRHGCLMYHSHWRWLLPLLTAGEDVSDLRLLFDWRAVPEQLIARLMALQVEPPAADELTEIALQLDREFGLSFIPPDLAGRAETTTTITATAPSATAVATVLHRQHKNYLILQAAVDLELSRGYLLTPPGGSTRPARLLNPRDLNGVSISQVTAGALFFVDSEPEIVTGSRLDCLSPPAENNGGRKLVPVN